MDDEYLPFYDDTSDYEREDDDGMPYDMPVDESDPYQYGPDEDGAQDRDESDPYDDVYAGAHSHYCHACGADLRIMGHDPRCEGYDDNYVPDDDEEDDYLPDDEDRRIEESRADDDLPF